MDPGFESERTSHDTLLSLDFELRSELDDAFGRDLKEVCCRRGVQRHQGEQPLTP